MSVEVHRAFDYVGRQQNCRNWVVLANRNWPRGLRKEDLGVDEWARHLAPSTRLMHWFREEGGRWSEFLKHYRQELRDYQDELERLADLSRKHRVVLLYGDRDSRYNPAEALRHILLEY